MPCGHSLRGVMLSVCLIGGPGDRELLSLILGAHAVGTGGEQGERILVIDLYIYRYTIKKL